MQSIVQLNGHHFDMWRKYIRNGCYDLQMLIVYLSHTVIDTIILACVKSLLVWAHDQYQSTKFELKL